MFNLECVLLVVYWTVYLITGSKVIQFVFITLYFKRKSSSIMANMCKVPKIGRVVPTLHTMIKSNVISNNKKYAMPIAFFDNRIKQ